MNGIFILLVAVLFVVGIIIVPLAAIWSLNLLFGLTIPYTLKTWAAALMLSGIVGSSPSFLKANSK